jgi:hypothetical protein
MSEAAHIELSGLDGMRYLAADSVERAVMRELAGRMNRIAEKARRNG